VQQLQSKLKTSRRTVFRDLNGLEEIGIKVELRDKGYKVKQSAATCRKLLVDRQVKLLNKTLASWLR
jgi:biotin operon repressor